MTGVLHVLLVGLMHVCNHYIQSFSDKQLIFVFCHNIKNIPQGFGEENGRATSISCQTYCYSGCEARLQDNSRLLAHVNEQGKRRLSECEPDRN